RIKMKTYIITRMPLACTLALALALAQPAPAQAFPIAPILIGAGAAVGGKVLVSDLLREAEDRATRVLKEGERTGDVLILNASNQLEVRLKQLQAILQDERTSTFAQLSDLKKQLFIEFNNILIELNEDILPALNY